MRWLRENYRLAALAAGWSAILVSSASAWDLVGASSDDHLWFVAPSSGANDALMLYHHAIEMDGAHYSRGQPLQERPEVMAAWANRLWLIFAPKISDDQPDRETFTVEVQRHPAIGVYSFDPADRLSVVASLDGLGNLVGFVGTPQGPVALRVPTQRAGAGVQAGEDSIAAEPVLAEPVLEQLRGARWERLELPEDLPIGGRYRLAVGSAPGNLLLLVASPGDHSRTVLHQRHAQGAWTPVEVPVDLRSVAAVTRCEAQVALVLQGARPGRVEIAYLRPGSLVSLGEFAAPSGRWGLFGLRDGMRLVEQSTQGGLRLRRIDPITGKLSPSEAMTSQGLLPLRTLHMPLLFAVAITVLLLVLIFKPASQAAAPTLPATMAVLGLTPRMLALAIDLALGGVATILLLGCTPAALLRLPMSTPDIADAAPSLWLIGSTMMHCTLGEIAAGRSVGKALLGARVVAAHGVRPALGSILVRNAFKIIVLLIPVLAVFGLLNHHLQGLGDLMARTLVVHTVSPKN